MGPEHDDLELASSFEHKGLRCEVRFLGDTPKVVAPIMPEDRRRSRAANRIEFTVSDGPNKIEKALLDISQRQTLVELLREIANRCITAIRSFGVAPEIRELYGVEHEEFERTLSQWRVEFREDASDWSYLVRPDDDFIGWGALRLASQPQGVTALLVKNWVGIEEAIQENIAPPAELEFKANAMEHMRGRNYRLALIESIIGLEIVLSRYIAEYLKAYSQTPKERIKEFLSPQFGLTSRLSGILDLTLNHEDLKNIDFAKALKAVSWRNKITHGTGHLPEGIPGETLESAISEVLSLTSLLTLRAKQAEISPQLMRISKELSGKHRLLRADIWYHGSHRFRAEFEVFDWASFAPEMRTLDDLVSELVDSLKALDARFVPTMHLFVRFFEFHKRLRAIWKEGRTAVGADIAL